MTDQDPPRASPQGVAARQARSAQALRDNLKRRKAQARGRRDGGAPGLSGDEWAGEGLAGQGRPAPARGDE